jgi:hypothetical protein
MTKYNGRDFVLDSCKGEPVEFSDTIMEFWCKLEKSKRGFDFLK